MDLRSKAERMKMLPATKMRTMDLQKHLQEFREKLRRQRLIDEIQPITGVQIRGGTSQPGEDSAQSRQVPFKEVLLNKHQQPQASFAKTSYGDEVYEFITHMLGLLVQGGPRLLMNKRAFMQLIERYPKRQVLKDYTNEELMFMI